MTPTAPLSFNPAAALALRSRLAGRLHVPGDAALETSRLRPADVEGAALVVIARDVAEVRAAVEFARVQRLPVALRGAARIGSARGALVIALDRVTLDGATLDAETEELLGLTSALA